IDGDGCQANCISPTCGDGILDADFNEQCDCGQDPFNLPAGCLTINANSPDASCRLNCQPQTCGDTITDPDAGEECDDGNFFPGDGCTGGCIIEVCGNGIIDLEKIDGSFVPSEECDDGENSLNHDGCVIECRREKPLWT